MLTADLGNIYMDEKDVASLLARVSGQHAPVFMDYKENITLLKRQLSSFSKYTKLIVVGHGGSVNSFKALSGLVPEGKSFEVLCTNEPDRIALLRRRAPKKSTVVVAVSKSGTNVTQLEALLAFRDYRIIVVTEPNSNPLHTMAAKEKWKVFKHPDIGGRFAGISSCAYVPLLFLGADAQKIDEGAKAMYKRCAPGMDPEENPALQLSLALFFLETKGYTEVFVPVYSTKFAQFLPLIIQLMHESVGKNAVGQTFYGDLAPESQHHTNQRFFGGRKNVVGLFVRVKEFAEKTVIKVPKELAKIPLQERTLSILDGIPYAKALDFEFQGVREHTIHFKIPYSVINVDKVDAKTAGEFMGFWHYVAIYSAWLRNVNPFDQPEVEFSKKHSFELRAKYRK